MDTQLDPIAIRLCPVCSKPIPDKRGGLPRVTCSDACNRQRSRERHRLLNPAPGWSVGLSPSVVGAAQEMIVVADLLKRGYFVFRSVSPGASCDLVLVIDRSIHRIDVTTGFRSAVGTLLYPKNGRDSGFYDSLAVVEKNGQITYLPALPQAGRIPRKMSKREYRVFAAQQAHAQPQPSP